MDLVPSDSKTFNAVAKRSKWKIHGPKTCFLVEGSDRIGGFARTVWRGKTVWSDPLGKTQTCEKSREGVGGEIRKALNSQKRTLHNETQ